MPGSLSSTCYHDQTCDYNDHTHITSNSNIEYSNTYFVCCGWPVTLLTADGILISQPKNLIIPHKLHTHYSNTTHLGCLSTSLESLLDITVDGGDLNNN